MSNQSTKKVDKLPGILLIIISLLLLGNNSYCQNNRNFDDSLLLKKEIDSVLAKHGLKSKGFAINVISISQQGGQTAYSITNNYYSDPNYVADSINYTFKIETINGKKALVFSPKHGTWTTPFLLYDSTKPKTTSLEGFISGIGFDLNLPNETYHMVGTKSSNPCTPHDPIFIYLGNDANPVVGFGDYGYDTRYYLYINGSVHAIPVRFSQ